MLLFAAGQGNRHYIKMLLCKVKGATCFADLKIYNGHSYASFRVACAARGLLDDDDMHDNIMEECAQCQMPRELRHTFAILLLWDPPVKPNELWEKYANDLAADFIHHKRQVDSLHCLLFKFIVETMVFAWLFCIGLNLYDMCTQAM